MSSRILPRNRRAISMMVAYALIAILVGYVTFIVIYYTITAINAEATTIMQATMCNVLLSMQEGGLTVRLATTAAKISGLLPRSAGACAKTIPPDGIAPTPATADVVLTSLADEVNSCWKRSRLAKKTTFTCVHYFKFKLESGTIDEAGLTKKLCGASAPTKFAEWKGTIAPGNTDKDTQCRGGNNLRMQQSVSDTTTSHSFRVYYRTGSNEEKEGVVEVEQQY